MNIKKQSKEIYNYLFLHSKKLLIKLLFVFVTDKKTFFIYFFTIIALIAIIFSFIFRGDKETDKANLEVSQEKIESWQKKDKVDGVFSFKLSIPSIQVDVPVIENINWQNPNEYLEALRRGAIHFKNTSLPNQGGNIVVSAHSFGNENYAGSYDSIFEDLDRLNENDLIYVRYQNKNYTYKVIEKKIVEPQDLSVIEDSKEEFLTLITCYPVGTIDERLVVKAKSS